jgi:hypothetical protein
MHLFLFAGVNKTKKRKDERERENTAHKCHPTEINLESYIIFTIH